jgi:hypothetical protein
MLGNVYIHNYPILNKNTVTPYNPTTNPFLPAYKRQTNVYCLLTGIRFCLSLVHILLFQQSANGLFLNWKNKNIKNKIT